MDSDQIDDSIKSTDLMTRKNVMTLTLHAWKLFSCIHVKWSRIDGFAMVYIVPAEHKARGVSGQCEAISCLRNERVDGGLPRMGNIHILGDAAPRGVPDGRQRHERSHDDSKRTSE